MNSGLTLISGPCVIESEKSCFLIAEKLMDIAARLGVDFFFKASFDKANRTSIHSYRGPGIEEGLKILNNLKESLKIKIATDIHEPSQAQLAAKVCDIIQIPAFLCRQTDLLIAAAQTGKLINVKKAQYMSPFDMKYVIEKIEESGNSRIMLCERGSCFGYNRLVVDMTSMLEMKKFGYPIVFDATHSVQLPGGNGSTTGGNAVYAGELAKAAAAIGIKHFFMEVHPEPDNALSDGPNMIKLDKVEDILIKLMQISDIVGN
jgi:2-dehydro-3-deoxyphosphooctonate aldolase (KDO 8-P synthase)